MKKLTLIVIIFSGCTTQNYMRKNPDGSTVTYNSTGLFQNAQLKGLNVDKETKTAKTGLTIQSQDNETAAEALKATVQAVVEGAIAGAAKAVK